MKSLILLAVLFAFVAARPQQQLAKNAEILAYSNDVGPLSYTFSYKTSDNSEREETAELRNVGTDNEAIAVRGSYKYVGNDGQTYIVTYIADENGFQPQGAHIPRK